MSQLLRNLCPLHTPLSLRRLTDPLFQYNIALAGGHDHTGWDYPANEDQNTEFNPVRTLVWGSLRTLDSFSSAKRNSRRWLRFFSVWILGLPVAWKGLIQRGKWLYSQVCVYSMALGNEKPISNLHDFLQVCVILFGKIRQIIFFCGKCIILQLTWRHSELCKVSPLEILQ